MKILLTGAAGGIGSTLGYQLFKEGHQLTIVDNFRNGYVKNLLIDGQTFGNFLMQDICSSNMSLKLEDEYDCIIHLAAITSLPDCEFNAAEAINVNVTGTMNILACAKSWNVPHVIFASTSAVYENNTEEALTEDLIVSPRLWYSLSKKMAEEICQSYRLNYGMNITTFRFFNVFGPRQDMYRKNPFLLNYLVREFTEGRQPILHSHGFQARDFIHVDDVLRLINIALSKKPNDTFNVCTGIALSVNQVASYVAEALNSSISPIFREASNLWDTYPGLFSGEYPLKKEIVQKEATKKTRGSYEKAKRLLGWEPNTDVKCLIQQTAKQMIESRG